MNATSSGEISLQLPPIPEWAKEEVRGLVREIAAASAAPVADGLLLQVRERLARHHEGSAETALGSFFLSALSDLATQGWLVRYDEQHVSLTAPTSEGLSGNEAKARVRSGHLVERDRQLNEPNMRAFVAEMEETRLFNGRWVSVYSLMRDGAQLCEQLRGVAAGDASGDPYKSVIDPYLQFVESTAVCEQTGFKLGDIWRYFRATWSSAYQSVPGRRMHVLVRDRAAEFHPVIGIAALSSTVVQLTVRDEWIGWESEAMLDKLKEGVTQADADYFDSLLTEAIADVYRLDFIEEGLLFRGEVQRPTAKTIARLEGEARRSRRAHEAYPRAFNHKSPSDAAEGYDWEAQARSYLFRSKRAGTLGLLLNARRQLRELGMDGPSKTGLQSAVASSAGRKALAVLIRSAKARRVGIDMLEITTCGALPPYSHLLGGKLVALLMMSPELVRAHKERYGQSASLIASAMKGEHVVREPQLVLLGTTSLYAPSSSQYNRLRVPAAELEGCGRGDLRFELLGQTKGYGSYHFSQDTMRLAERVAAHNHAGRRVNSIFGEGVNPKFRKLREALSLAGFPTERVLRHGSQRLVYGVPLAENFRQVLQGRTSRPRYLLRVKRAEQGTALLARFWRRRWLTSRLRRKEVLDAVSEQTLSRPVRHGARVPMPPDDFELPLFAAGD